MFSKLVTVVIACCLLGSSPLPLPAQTLAGEWPQYRGPARDGVSQEKGLAKGWSDTGPPEMWRRPIGPSFAGISIVDDRLVTMESDSQNEYAVCLDVETGKQIWRTVVGPFFEEAFGNGPRATPTVDGPLTFVVSSTGNLAALGTESGETVWNLELTSSFGAEVPRRGFSGSVLISGDLAIVEPGGEGGRGIVALDKVSGEIRWSVGDAPAGYSSPLSVDFNGMRQFVFLRKEGPVAYNGDGALLWQKEFAPDITAKIAMPVLVAPDLLFFSASYDVGAVALKMRQNGESVVVEELWRDRVMRNHFSTSVAMGGHIFGFDNATLKCIDAQTGEQRWAKRGGLGKGSLIFADGDLIVLSESGKLLLVEASPEKFVEKAKSQVLEGRCWTSPSLANGRLYLRNLSEIVSFQLGI